MNSPSIPTVSSTGTGGPNHRHTITFLKHLVGIKLKYNLISVLIFVSPWILNVLGKGGNLLLRIISAVVTFSSNVTVIEAVAYLTYSVVEGAASVFI